MQLWLQLGLVRSTPAQMQMMPLRMLTAQPQGYCSLLVFGMERMISQCLQCQWVQWEHCYCQWGKELKKAQEPKMERLAMIELGQRWEHYRFHRFHHLGQRL